MRFRRTAGAPESLLVAAKAAADTALRLAPDLGAANLALGYYHYWGRRDYQRARAAFGAALRRNPSDGDALYALGAVSRREGRWGEAVTSLCRGADLDPRSGSKAWDCGLAAFFTRDYSRAERYFDRTIMLDPSNAFAYTSKARLQLDWHGDVRGARETLHAARGRVELATLASGVNDVALMARACVPVAFSIHVLADEPLAYGVVLGPLVITPKWYSMTPSSKSFTWKLRSSSMACDQRCHWKIQCGAAAPGSSPCAVRCTNTADSLRRPARSSAKMATTALGDVVCGMLVAKTLVGAVRSKVR